MNNDNSSILEFYINDMVVGTFEGNRYPVQDGEYKYMPYRGPGHLEMQNRLKKDGKAQCKYILKNKDIIFDITACPKYGIVVLANIREE
jgi:hypothetical protein